MTLTHRRRFGATLASLVLASGLLATGILGAGILGATPAIAATDSLTWGVRTADGDLGAGRQNFAYTLAPGQSMSDSLVISNHGDDPLALTVTTADGFTTTSGTLDLVTADTESVAVGAWMQATTKNVEVKPGDTLDVPFTVTVPADATPGDYAGGIVTALPQPVQESGIAVDRRLGIRVHLRVSGELAPELSVGDIAIDYGGNPLPFAAGSADVSYTVTNSGNVRVAAGQRVALSGPFGLFAAEGEDVPAVPELLPGESWTTTTHVAGVVPAFWLGATVVLEPELPAVSGSTPGIAAVTATGATAAVPWTGLVLVLVVIGAPILLVIVRRRRRVVQAEREQQRVDEAVAEALELAGR